MTPLSQTIAETRPRRILALLQALSAMVQIGVTPLTTERGSKYDYPEGMTADEKRKFRAKARKEARA